MLGILASVAALAACGGGGSDPSPAPPGPPPPPVAAPDPAQLAAGTGFHVALKGDGSGLAWGRRSDALGSGALVAGTAARAVAVAATQVAAGNGYSIAAGSDGRAYGWGARQFDGTLGSFAFNDTDPFALPVVLPGVDGVVQVATAAGYTADNVQYAYALRSDGTVWHWPGVVEIDRSNPFDVKATVQPRPVEGLTRVVALSRGAGHPIAVLADGSVRALRIARTLSGDRATHVATATPVAGVAAVVQASCGDATCLALTTDGAVVAWGDNRFGQLGSGDTAAQVVPVTVPGLNDVARVSYNNTGSTSCALTAGGRVWYWGVNPGNGNLAPSLVPTLLSTIDNVVEIDGCTRLMRRADGTVWGLGFENGGELAGGMPAGGLQPTQAPGVDLN